MKFLVGLCIFILGGISFLVGSHMYQDHLAWKKNETKKMKQLEELVKNQTSSSFSNDDLKKIIEDVEEGLQLELRQQKELNTVLLEKVNKLEDTVQTKCSHSCPKPKRRVVPRKTTTKKVQLCSDRTGYLQCVKETNAKWDRLCYVQQYVPKSTQTKNTKKEYYVSPDIHVKEEITYTDLTPSEKNVFCEKPRQMYQSDCRMRHCH